MIVARPARSESGEKIGSVECECDDYSEPPLVVRDQHGSTWVWNGQAYVRRRCVQGHFYGPRR